MVKFTASSQNFCPVGMQLVLLFSKGGGEKLILFSIKVTPIGRKHCPKAIWKKGKICGEASDTHITQKARGGPTTILAAAWPLLLLLRPTFHTLWRAGAAAGTGTTRAILPFHVRFLFLADLF